MSGTNDLLQRLQDASEGLLWRSEVDRPFEVLFWEDAAIAGSIPEAIAQKLGYAASEPVRQLDWHQFFEPVLEAPDRHSEGASEAFLQESHARRDRYRSLVSLLEERLRDLHIYRIGGPVASIAIVGKTSAGDWAGLATKVVET